MGTIADDPFRSRKACLEGVAVFSSIQHGITGDRPGFPGCQIDSSDAVWCRQEQKPSVAPNVLNRCEPCNVCWAVNGSARVGNSEIGRASCRERGGRVG